MKTLYLQGWTLKRNRSILYCENERQKEIQNEKWKLWYLRSVYNGSKRIKTTVKINVYIQSNKCRFQDTALSVKYGSEYKCSKVHIITTSVKIQTSYNTTYQILWAQEVNIKYILGRWAITKITLSME